MFEIMYLAKIGIIAGLLIAMVGMFLGMIKFTTLDLTKYFGCLLTGHAAGRINFIAGFVFHMIASVALAILYNFVIVHFNVAVSLKNALHFGIIHILISGCMLPVFDKIKPCVVQGSIKRMSYFGSNYGISAVVAYVLTHMTYAIAVFFMLAR